MAEEKISEEDRELPHGELENSLVPAGSCAGHAQHEGHGHSLSHHSVSKHAVTASVPKVSNLSKPGIQPPGILIDTYIPRVLVTIKETSNSVAQFHNSESEDIYDLYNACNGAVRDDGFLDISKLDELSNEEREILNVKRLREIWQHTISNCAVCAGIVRTLNSVRQIVGEEEFE
jgi:hypothetical protein